MKGDQTEQRGGKWGGEAGGETNLPQTPVTNNNCDQCDFVSDLGGLLPAVKPQPGNVIINCLGCTDRSEESLLCLLF